MDKVSDHLKADCDQNKTEKHLGSIDIILYT